MTAKQLRKIVFVAEEFSPRSPAQQLLDRFLIGYPIDGEFRRMDRCRIVLASSGNEQSAEVKSRVQEFSRQVVNAPGDAVSEADAVVVVWRGTGAKANHTLLENTLQAMPHGARCFVHGTLANTLSAAQKVAALAAT